MSTSAPNETRDDTTDEELVPPGHSLRPKSLALFALALLVPFMTMCADLHFGFSVPVGALACAVAAFALLDFLGTFDDAPVAGATSLRSLALRLVELAGSTALVVALVRLAVDGRVPGGVAGAALAIPAAMLWQVTAGFRVLSGFGAVDPGRPLFSRAGFWLVALNVLLYVPLLGAYSLSDPWETHYGEVAREMLARDDWISTWWAQENWFWSKPVLDFWLQALSFSLFGVRFGPDRMLSAAGAGFDPRPEWAARLPIFVFTLIATYVLYRAVAQRFGRRAGFLGGLALTTMPYWYVIGRQSMTDMPYVAPLSAALGLVLLGLGTDPERRVTVHGVRIGSRVFGVSAYHALFVLVLVSVIPQVLYLFSRHLTLQLAAAPHGFRWHLDEIPYGSAGNCGIPGNEPCHMAEPVDPSLQPGLMAIGWCVLAALLLWANRGERRVQRLYFLAAWYATALAALAKGAPGLVLPLVIALVGIAAARRFRDFARLELVGLALLVACVCLPWYVQMFARHGSPFTDRLLFHDMYKRAFVHVHDTNTGDDVSFRYYVWQLGYGLFPWTGLGAAGLLAFQREGDESKSLRAELLAFLALWFAIAFAMFSVSLTKFHHYALPCVPPIAMLAGIWLDRALPRELPRGRRLVEYALLFGLSGLLLLYGALRCLPGSLLGAVDAKASLWVAAPSLAAGLALFGLALFRFPEAPESDPAERYQSSLLALLGVGAAVALALAGSDLFWPDDPEGPARITQLASYNYKRAWPSSLEFRAVFAAVCACGVAATAAFVSPRLRAHAAALLCSVGVWSAAWTLDVYVVRAASHYGQRETIIEYYRRRSGPEEPLVAFQMNWKGENFYTGNRIPAFVSSATKFKTYLDEERERGTRVLFFTTEHSREASLKSELGQITRFEKLTNKTLSNKFFLARVEL
ncbi:MAG TPA: glycosyltransferase family 39 protein [Polyangiaceae bacterium]